MDDMAGNDVYLINSKLDGILKNVDPQSHKPVANAELINTSLIVYGGYVEYSPPEVYDPQNPDPPSPLPDRFDKTVYFPTGLFHPAYQPIVLINNGYHEGALAKITTTFRVIDYASFTVTVVRTDTSTAFNTNQGYFFTYIAMGVSGGLLL